MEHEGIRGLQVDEVHLDEAESSAEEHPYLGELAGKDFTMTFLEYLVS